jgi:hypothetical protein
MRLPESKETRYQAIIGSQVAGPFTLEGLESLAYLGKISPDTLISVEDRFEFTAIKSSAFARRLFPRAEGSASPHQLTEAKFERVADQSAPQAKIDVYDILGEIRQSEIASGRDFVREDRFKISKRSRDFWIMVIAGNVVLIGGGIAMQNTTSIVFGFAGSGMYTFGLLWSMYGVMDRY